MKGKYFLSLLQCDMELHIFCKKKKKGRGYTFMCIILWMIAVETENVTNLKFHTTFL